MPEFGMGITSSTYNRGKTRGPGDDASGRSSTESRSSYTAAVDTTSLSGIEAASKRPTTADKLAGSSTTEDQLKSDSTRDKNTGTTFNTSSTLGARSFGYHAPVQGVAAGPATPGTRTRPSPSPNLTSPRPTSPSLPPNLSPQIPTTPAPTPARPTGFWSGAGNWLNNNIVQPVNDHVIQPVWENVVKPAVDAGAGLVLDAVPLVTNMVTWPTNTVEDLAQGLWTAGTQLFKGEFVAARDTIVDTATDLVLAPVELIAGTVGISLHATVSAIDTGFSLGQTRTLTTNEINYLQSIYGSSIDYSKIEVLSGGIRDWVPGMRPHAVGNDIWMDSSKFVPDANGNPTSMLTPHGLQTLGHEGAHVSQYQTGGPGYVGSALVAQGLSEVGLGPGYDLMGSINSGVPFSEMNPEQQAAMAEYIGAAMALDSKGQLNQNNFQKVSRLSLTPSQFNNIVVPAQTQILAGIR